MRRYKRKAEVHAEGFCACGAGRATAVHSGDKQTARNQARSSGPNLLDRQALEARVQGLEGPLYFPVRTGHAGASKVWCKYR